LFFAFQAEVLRCAESEHWFSEKLKPTTSHRFQMNNGSHAAGKLKWNNVSHMQLSKLASVVEHTFSGEKQL
jgi:hypothetical protein